MEEDNRRFPQFGGLQVLQNVDKQLNITVHSSWGDEVKPPPCLLGLHLMSNREDVAERTARLVVGEERHRELGHH